MTANPVDRGTPEGSTPDRALTPDDVPHPLRAQDVFPLIPKVVDGARPARPRH